jgi:hypothetical protein
MRFHREHAAQNIVFYIPVPEPEKQLPPHQSQPGHKGKSQDEGFEEVSSGIPVSLLRKALIPAIN